MSASNTYIDKEKAYPIANTLSNINDNLPCCVRIDLKNNIQVERNAPTNRVLFHQKEAKTRRDGQGNKTYNIRNNRNGCFSVGRRTTFVVFSYPISSTTGEVPYAVIIFYFVLPTTAVCKIQFRYQLSRYCLLE